MRRSATARLVIIVAILSLSAACAATVSGCGDSPPVEAYRNFEKALKEGDLETAWSLLSTKGQEALTKEQFMDVFSLPSMQEVIKDLPPAKIVSCEIEGDRAVITAEGTGLQEGNTSKTELALENGEWKLESAAGP